MVAGSRINPLDSVASSPRRTAFFARRHFAYRQKAWEGDAKDYEFSRLSMKEHWRSGYHDTRNTLQHKDWLAMPEHNDGISTHDIHRTGAK